MVEALKVSRVGSDAVQGFLGALEKGESFLVNGRAESGLAENLRKAKRTLREVPLDLGLQRLVARNGRSGLFFVAKLTKWNLKGISDARMQLEPSDHLND
jgi:hypothetical protein